MMTCCCQCLDGPYSDWQAVCTSCGHFFCSLCSWEKEDGDRTAPTDSEQYSIFGPPPVTEPQTHQGPPTHTPTPSKQKSPSSFETQDTHSSELPTYTLYTALLNEVRVLAW